MKKLIVLPIMLSLVSIIGSSPAEAKGWHGGRPGGRPGTIHRPKKRCTRKRPCSRMPELPFFPGDIQPMPRGGLAPYPGTQWR